MVTCLSRGHAQCSALDICWGERSPLVAGVLAGTLLDGQFFVTPIPDGTMQNLTSTVQSIKNAAAQQWKKNNI